MEEFDRRPSRRQDQHPPPQIGINADAGDRFPPWSFPETKELLAIRAEMDRNFLETKHNRLLWVSMADKMKEKGFNRNHEQCKCKWKNLVTRYKGCETMEPEAMRLQFPFYSDLHAIFTARIQKNWWVEGPSQSKRKATEFLSDEESGEEDKGKTTTKKMTRKTRGERESCNVDLKGILKGFVKQQLEMEKQWREAFRVREEGRRLKEMEWRKNMEALERERMVMERMWREREEQRREREEVRAEKRDALITALLSKLLS